MPSNDQRRDSPLGAMPSNNTPDYAKRSVFLTWFDRFASRATRWAGSPLAFGAATLSVVIWAATGHLFQYSENWRW